MKTNTIIMIRRLAVGVLLASFLPGLVSAQMAMDETSPWPRTRSTNGNSVTIFQPQVESWTSNSFKARAVIEFKPAGAKDDAFGVAWFSANGRVDRDARLVTLDNLEITKVHFPEAPQLGAKALETLKQVFPAGVRTVSLDYLITALGFKEAEARQKQTVYSHEPPEIIWATNRTVLIVVDGEPVLRPITNSPVQRVINTPALLLKFDGKYFLSGGDRLFLADSLDGPWRLSLNAPNEIAALVPKPAANAGAPTSDTPPRILVRTRPTELVVTGGEPDFRKISGTKLLYAADTDSQLFYDSENREAYLLLSGRWFKAKSLTGPWSYVVPQALPDDFAKIPADSPQAVVLASVPGTTQAEEALIENLVPTTATVNRHTAKLDVTYDGEPQFKPIKGTDMSYAVNAPLPVILCKGTYYALENGVWFTAKSATGPWAVATELPEEIYTIPPDSPVYYATFAKIYDVTDDEVEVGYTAGYQGEYEDDGTVVYGTGYDYEPYYGHDCYYGWGSSWGYGYVYVPWYNWWVWRDWWDHPGAPRYALIDNVYDRWRDDDHVTPYNRAQTAAAARRLAENGVNYPALYGRYRNSANAQRLVPPANTLAVNPYTRPQGELKRGETPRGATLLTQVRQSPGGGRDLYAAPDGQVYLRKNDGWYQRQGGNWNYVSPPQAVVQRARANTGERPAIAMPNTPNTRAQAVANRPAVGGGNYQQQNIQALERERAARQIAQQRQQNIQQNRANISRPSAPVNRPVRSFGGGRRR